MAESIVVPLLRELSTFLLNQSTTLGEDLERDVRFIRDELGSMRAFLRDVEAREDDALELQEWVKQVRDVAYDTEDVLDEFVMRFGRRRAHGLLSRVQKVYRSIKNLRARRQISSEMKNLRSRVNDIYERHNRYQSIYDNQGARSTAARGNDLISGLPLIDEAKLVGIDEPKSKLLSQILDGDSRLKVVSVVGMGGLGKTTLVRKVYEDVAVKEHFQSHAWLTISQTLRITEAIKNLIRQLCAEIKEQCPQELVECMDVMVLREFVRDFLQKRRYVIVVDDVWNIKSWDAIKCMLPDCNLGSRIMLTTRKDDVASYSCLETHHYVHEMGFLSKKESWTLFRNRVFQSSDCPPHLEDVSRRFLKKCEGLPLAIVVISGVLALKDKHRISEWEMIYQSIGSGQGPDGMVDRMKRILVYSYTDLPHYLKSCLLYLSIYPEDYDIYVVAMVEKWISHGFVQEREGMSSRGIGNDYASELINRSLIQVATTYTDGTAETIHVHDILLEMIIAKSKELNFATIVNGNYNGSTSDKVRRLVIHDFVDNSQIEELSECFKSIRSLEFFGDKSGLSNYCILNI